MRTAANAIAAPARSFLPPLAGLIGKSLDWGFRRHTRRRDGKLLRQMPDSLLKDIGISRSEIDWLLEHGRPVDLSRGRSILPPL